MKQRKLEKDSNVILKDEEEKSKESPKPNAFMIIWLGQLISLIGTDITKFALRIKTYQDTGSVTQYGFLTFFSEMPAMLLSPFAGVIVDRYPRKYIMMVADAATASTTLGLALLYYYGSLHIGHIYIANIVGSICNAFQWTAFTASVPLIVPKDQLTKVGGMSQAAPALSMLVGNSFPGVTPNSIGPGLSGLLLGYFDLNVIFLIEFVTFLIAVMATSSTEIPRPPKGKEVKGTVKKEVLNALQYIWERKGLFALICFSSIGHFSNGLSQVLFTPLLLNFSRATVVGSVLSISGTGALLGSSVLSLWGGPKRKVYGVLGVGFVQGLLFACSGLIPNAYFIFFVGFMYMSFIPLLRVCRESLWQRKVPPGLLGRILAIQKGISQAAIPIAAVLGGIVADTIFEPLMEENAVLGKMLGAYLGTGPGRGVGLMFIVVGLFNATVAALAFMYKPLRYLDTDLPDMI